MKIAMACDHGAFEYKEEIKLMLEAMGHEVEDFGCYSTEAVDYADMVVPAMDSIVSGKNERGIVLCGTGIGVSITANKVDGIRCALVHDCFTAHTTREHNDSNVLAMGQRVIGIELAKEITRTWVSTAFSQDERHARRIQKIMALEKR